MLPQGLHINSLTSFKVAAIMPQLLMYFFRVGILKLFKQNGKMEPRISLYTQLEKLVKWQGNEEKAKEVKIKAQEYAQ